MKKSFIVGLCVMMIAVFNIQAEPAHRFSASAHRFPSPPPSIPTDEVQFQADYAALPTDCEELQFLLLYKLINLQVVTQVVLGYVQYKGFFYGSLFVPDFIATDLSCCRLDFNPADPTAFPYKVDITGLQLINGVGRGLRMDYALIGRARFDGSDLSPGTLTDGCQGQPTSFRGSTVPEGTYITFIGSGPKNLTKLNYADLSGVHWNNTIFKYTDLTCADLSHSNFHVVLFSGTVLNGTDFTHAKLNAAVCDPNNPPIVKNTILPSGRVTSSALDFCRSFDHSARAGNVPLS